MCPSCEKKTWVRYVFADNPKNYLSEEFGRCDRESKCNHSAYPKFVSSEADWKRPLQPAPPNKALVYIPRAILEHTLKAENYQLNTFLQNLLLNVPFPFLEADVQAVTSQYFLGTVSKGYRAGAITFPFISIGGNIRTIQVKQFDQANHTTGTDFLHSMLNKCVPPQAWLAAYLQNSSFVSCLFGEHLLNRFPLNPVALVEAPKTAVYGTLYFGSPASPKNMLWLAVYNLSSLNVEKCKALAGRKVYLFPDLSRDGTAHELWTNRAASLQCQIQDSTFTVSNLIENLASNEQRENCEDLADILIRQDWRLFRPETSHEPIITQIVTE